MAYKKEAAVADAPPTLFEVMDAAVTLRMHNIEAEKFFDYYTQNAWKIGRRRVMRDWRAALRTWKTRFDSGCDYSGTN